jgi:6-phosphogluconate dehydrogenase
VGAHLGLNLCSQRCAQIISGIPPKYATISGEDRWTVEAAIEEAVPADVLSTALYARLRSRQEYFGGHIEGNEPIDPEPKPEDSQGHSAAQNAAE